jgi:hypothetical protein
MSICARLKATGHQARGFVVHDLSRFLHRRSCDEGIQISCGINDRGGRQSNTSEEENKPGQWLVRLFLPETPVLPATPVDSLNRQQHPEHAIDPGQWPTMSPKSFRSTLI